MSMGKSRGEFDRESDINFLKTFQDANEIVVIYDMALLVQLTRMIQGKQFPLKQ
jgi:hypothetical protein